MSAGGNRGGYRAGHRDPYVLVGIAEREAILRALDARGQMTARRWRVFGAVIALTTTWAKLHDYVHAEQISAMTGVALNHCYEELEALAAAGLIVSRRERGHKGRRLLGVVDPATPAPTWFKTAEGLELADRWAAKYLADGADGPAAHTRLAEQFEGRTRDLVPNLISPGAGTKRVPEPGLKESLPRDMYQEVVQEDQVPDSSGAPLGARGSSEGRLRLIPSWHPVRKDRCLIDDEFTLVNGESLCERHWLDAA